MSMGYPKIYNQIIERAQNRKLEGYKEKYHIIPKCMGGGDVKPKTNLNSHFDSEIDPLALDYILNNV